MRFALCALLAFWASLVSAAPLARDLGEGLAYFRIHQLPADLPTDDAARRQPCVLDLRFVRADAAGALTLEAWLKFRAAPRTPVLILANADTSPALLTPLTMRSAAAGLVVLGPPGPDFAPDIAIPIATEADRRAYDAFERGADVAALLNDTPAKPRNDEAALANGHATDAPTSNGKSPEPAAPKVIDPVLQRAVHLHRTLLALKKL